MKLNFMSTMRIENSVTRVVYIVGIIHVISSVLASNLFIDTHDGDDTSSQTSLYLMNGQTQSVKSKMQLRGKEVEKKATRASQAKRKGTSKLFRNHAVQNDKKTKQSSTQSVGKKATQVKKKGKQKGKTSTSEEKATQGKKKEGKQNGKTKTQMNMKKNIKKKAAQPNTTKAAEQSTKAKTKKKKKKTKQSQGRTPVTSRQPVATQAPPNRPSSSSCFSIDAYNSIDDDIIIIKNNIPTDRERSHFLGGIVRMAAHDFMDYDQNDPSNPMGMDGCYDQDDPSNKGLETIWCQTCELRILYRDKYSHLSRSDFWVASANAVIRQTSIDNLLDLRDTFLWGRKDSDTCPGSGDRLPETSGCDQVEDVFLRRMGLTWTDTVALLGAHTLGRGDIRFSGHDGTWSSSDKEAQVFDKQYYEAFFTETWRPRNMGQDTQDWRSGFSGGRLMLNTDMCLVFDINEYVERNIPCCTGQDQCFDVEAVMGRCPMYASLSQRSSATEAVREMLGGSLISKNNAPFYNAFAKAWGKATTLGMDEGLSSLVNSC